VQREKFPRSRILHHGCRLLPVPVDGTSGGSPDFEIICGGALATTAASSVEIIGGGTVRWSIAGATSTGAGSKIIRDLYSVGVISFGADTT
jgi:hypothetical protein